MARTAADVLVEGIIDWGVDTVFGLPGDGINGIMEALRTRQDPCAFHPGAPRRSGCVHGLRLCEIHGTPRMLSRHFGTGRDSFVEWIV